MPTITKTHPRAVDAFQDLYSLVASNPYGVTRTDLEAHAIRQGVDLKTLAFWIDALQAAHLAEVRSDLLGQPRLYPIL